MPLLPIWKNQPKEVLKFKIQQILSMAGDGKLLDGSECSHEFRTFLAEVPSPFLIASARYCLEHAFQDSGLVLQDIVNEVGRRLEFKVDHGLYRGTKNKTGFDGCWKAVKCRDMIIEVKTTDYITIPLHKLNDYRRSLAKDGKVDEDACFLIVLGREDAGSLEDQVRGSRYGWDTRLISVEALLKLLNVKEMADQESTISQIRALLQPIQTTKLDAIIDIVFSTAADVEDAVKAESADAADEPQQDQKPKKQSRTPSDQIEAKRQQAVDSFAKANSLHVVKQRRTLYRTGEGQTRICVIVSKHYDNAYQPYWYAYHPHWDTFLKEAKAAHVILACMDRNVAYAIPYSEFSCLLPKLNRTENESRTYWHIALTQLSPKELAINLTSVGEKLPLAAFEYTLHA